MSTKNLDEMSLKELKAEAKKLGIKDMADVRKKKPIIDAINEVKKDEVDPKKSTPKSKLKGKDKEIADLKAKIAELEEEKSGPVPPQPKKILNSKGEVVVFEKAEVVGFLKSGPYSPDHKHCSMSDQTTKFVPNELFE